MNSKLYLAIGGALVVIILVIVLISNDANRNQRSAKAPPDHPPIATGVPTKNTTGAPSKENVSRELLHEIEGLKKLVKKNPNDVKSTLQLANLLFDSHKPEEAIQYYKIVLQREPQNIDARLDLSVCYYNLGKLGEAVVETRRILSYEPNHTGALYNMGALEATRGNKLEATKWWNKVIALDAKSVDAQRAKEALSKLAVSE